MLTIGLTGGIGSGKTTVANLFQELGIPHIDSDLLAREAVLPGTMALAQILARYGKYILLDNGELNRKNLREIIFANPQERLWLEELLHPIIRQHMQQQLQQLSTPYALLVIPLLIDRPAHPLVQRVLVIDSTKELQMQRVTLRDQVDPAHVESIIAAQAARNRLLQAADDVIVNDANLEHLKKQVIKLHQFYLQISSVN